MRSLWPHRILVSSCLTLFSLINPSVAFAQSGGPPPGLQGTGETAENTSLDFVSDGSAVEIEELGVTIAPPKDWEVLTNSGNISMVMRAPEPDREKAKPGETLYRRNITVAAIHEPSPIDEKRAESLKKQLKERFSDDPRVSEFEVLEHQFFNYQKKNDGLLVYTSLYIDEFPMMQMHMLVSGSKRQFLLSYTDLAKDFQSETNGHFDEAWSTMATARVTGQPPSRMATYMRYGGIAGGILLLLLVIWFLRRRSAKRDFVSEAESFDADGGDDALDDGISMVATLNGRWNLNHGKSSTDTWSDDDWSIGEEEGASRAVGTDDDLPKTKKTSYVSRL